MRRAWLALAALTLALVLPTPTRAQDDRQLTQLIEQVKRGDRRAVAALVRHGAAAVPGLASAIKDGDQSGKETAAWALARIAAKVGEQARAAVPALGTALRSKDGILAAEAGRALGAIGAAAVPELVEALKDGDPAARLHAARAVAKIGPAAKATSGPLLDVLKKSRAMPQVQDACMDALGALGPAAKTAVPELLKLGEARRKALDLPRLLVALGRIGPSAKEAVPFLTDVLDKEASPALKYHALIALARIDPSNRHIGAVLVQEIGTPGMPKLSLLEALAQGGKLDKVGLKVVAEMMRDKDAGVRLYAATLVGRAEPNNAAVVSVLIESLQEKDAALRLAAARTLGEIRPRDPAVANALRERASDRDPAVRAAAAAALLRLNPKR